MSFFKFNWASSHYRVTACSFESGCDTRVLSFVFRYLGGLRINNGMWLVWNEYWISPLGRWRGFAPITVDTHPSITADRIFEKCDSCVVGNCKKKLAEHTLSGEAVCRQFAVIADLRACMTTQRAHTFRGVCPSSICSNRRPRIVHDDIEGTQVPGSLSVVNLQ